jgi:membrane fusion protein, multidrug efflux system
MTTESTAEPKSSKRRRVLLTLALIVVCGAVVIGLRWYLHGRFHVETDDASVAGDVIVVTPQVSGTVAKILVEDTVAVKAGDVLVELDPTDARLASERAEADLLRTVRDVRSLYSQTETLAADAASAKADLAVAQVDRDRAMADLARRRAVGVDGGVMGEELAHAEEGKTGADARLLAAQRRAEAAQKRLAAQAANTDGIDPQHHPHILAAEATLRQALINEGRTQVRAPVDGQVARRSVTAGEFVATGTPLMSIVPLASVWVDANFKEAQLQNVRVGQAVELMADIYGPSTVFHGHVVGLDAGSGSAFALLPAQNATGNWIKVVQRVPVRIELDPKEVAEHPLRVGLSMTADVDTSSSGAAVATARPVPAMPGYDQVAAAADARIAQLVAEAFAIGHHAAPVHKGHAR